MILTKDMQELTAIFEKHGVDYALVGGGAVIFYGYARTTQDIDFLLNPSAKNLPRILDALNRIESICSPVWLESRMNRCLPTFSM